MVTFHKIMNLGVGLLLAGGAALRTFWSYGGPEWSYWLGNLAFGTFFIIPGVTIMFAPGFAVFWMQSFGGTARGIKLTNQVQLKPLQKLVLYALALMDLSIGLAIITTNLYRAMSGCSPNGDCPGL